MCIPSGLRFINDSSSHELIVFPVIWIPIKIILSIFIGIFVFPVYMYRAIKNKIEKPKFIHFILSAGIVIILSVIKNIILAIIYSMH